MKEFDEESIDRLTDAIEEANIEELNNLAKEEYPLSTIKITDSQLTALGYALCEDIPNSEVIKTLLNLGCDPNAKSSEGNAILVLAIKNEHITTDIIKYLILRGASRDFGYTNGKSATMELNNYINGKCDRTALLKIVEETSLVEAESYFESSKVTALLNSVEKIRSAPKDAPPKKKFAPFCISNSDNPDVLEAFEEFGKKITSWHQETSKSLINGAPQAEISLYSPTKASYIDLTSLQHSVESYSTISYLAKNLLGYDLPILSTTFSISMHAGLSIINSFNKPWHIELLKTSSFYAKLEISKMLANQQESLDKKPVDLSSFIDLCGYETLIYTSLGLASGTPILSGISGAASCLNNYNSPQGTSTSANAVSLLVGGVSLFMLTEANTMDNFLSSITNMGASHIITNAVVNSFYGETTALEEAV